MERDQELRAIAQLSALMATGDVRKARDLENALRFGRDHEDLLRFKALLMDELRHAKFGTSILAS